MTHCVLVFLSFNVWIICLSVPLLLRISLTEYLMILAFYLSYSHILFIPIFYSHSLSLSLSSSSSFFLCSCLYQSLYISLTIFFVHSFTQAPNPSFSLTPMQIITTLVARAFSQPHESYPLFLTLVIHFQPHIKLD